MPFEALRNFFLCSKRTFRPLKPLSKSLPFRKYENVAFLWVVVRAIFCSYWLSHKVDFDKLIGKSNATPRILGKIVIAAQNGRATSDVRFPFCYTRPTSASFDSARNDRIRSDSREKNRATNFGGPRFAFYHIILYRVNFSRETREKFTFHVTDAFPVRTASVMRCARPLVSLLPSALVQSAASSRRLSRLGSARLVEKTGEGEGRRDGARVA